MQRLNHTLAPLWADARRNQTADDDRRHHEHVAALIYNAAALPQQDIPAHLHEGGPAQLRHVDNDDIARLRLGKSIALATRLLLCGGAGNQRLSIAASDGASMARLLGVRRARLHGALPSTSETAAIGVLGAGGACNEHAAVAFELARATGHAAGKFFNSEEDHTVVILCPALGERAVVIDGWTTFPNSCLRADSAFVQATPNEQHAQGQPLSPDFNLITIDRVHAALQQQFGPAPIMQALLDDFNLQRLLRNPGDVTLLPPSRPGQPETYQPTPVSDALLENAANQIGSLPFRSIRVTLADARGNALPRTRERDVARQRLEQETLANSDGMIPQIAQLARFRALRTPDRRASVALPATAAVAVDATTQARIALSMHATARSTVRDIRLPSRNILYRTDSGDTFSTTTAPPELIAQAQHGVDVANARNFPVSYIHDGKARLNNVMTNLEQCVQQRPATRLVIESQRTLLDLLDTELAQLPVGQQADMLLHIDAMQLRLHPDTRLQAANLLASHYSRLGSGA